MSSISARGHIKLIAYPELLLSLRREETLLGLLLAAGLLEPFSDLGLLALTLLGFTSGILERMNTYLLYRSWLRATNFRETYITVVSHWAAETQRLVEV